PAKYTYRPAHAIVALLLSRLHFRAPLSVFLSFLFNDTATTEIYTLSLHDALPILKRTVDDRIRSVLSDGASDGSLRPTDAPSDRDRKSTRLNSSHVKISYAVFCLKKKKVRNRNAYNELTPRRAPQPPRGEQAHPQP